METAKSTKDDKVTILPGFLTSNIFTQPSVKDRIDFRIPRKFQVTCAASAIMGGTEFPSDASCCILQV